ncbi:WYL domain-containing protein [Paenibacillus sp. HWE-109]|uniref:helix-turn-helix transcriptional regulator n=1 Tax=Paenibacillus sp. HWE-109 TaxID=1306526 RepID=UPI001EDD7670|nr:WYL domain-containing protein [Paenibacillus sp. HWE-109]UKS27939.1 WYL domain-containing protein [Paenibacillus sp. HWE-109]
MAKLDYMLSILWLLRSKGQMTAEQLAEALELSVRTVYRYIDVLCVSGVPIISESGHGGGFKLPSTFLSLPLFFDTTELTAMAHSVLLAQQAQYPFAESLKKALQKIEHRLSDSQLQELRRHVTGLDVIEPSRSSSLQPILQELERAVADRTTLSLRYSMWEGLAPEERMVDPYGLIYRLNKWYLVVYCHLRKSLRVFRVDRIRDLSFSGMTFTRPEDFSVKAYFLKMNQEEKADGSTVNVRLHSKDDILDQICNQWFLQTYLVERSEGEARFIINTDAMLTYMPYLLLSFGKHVHVLEPSILKETLSELARDLAKYYET